VPHNINGEGIVEARFIIFNEYIPLDGNPFLAYSVEKFLILVVEKKSSPL